MTDSMIRSDRDNEDTKVDQSKREIDDSFDQWSWTINLWR